MLGMSECHTSSQNLLLSVYLPLYLSILQVRKNGHEETAKKLHLVHKKAMIAIAQVNDRNLDHKHFHSPSFRRFFDPPPPPISVQYESCESFFSFF